MPTSSRLPATEDSPKARLKACEEKVAGYRTALLEAGRALWRVQNERLYRVRNYDSFEDYGREELALSRSRIYQLIKYARVHHLLSTRVDTVPDNEAQARPLTRLLDAPDTLVAVWREACQRYDRLSKKKVKAVAAAVRGDTASNETDSEASPPDDSPSGDSTSDDAESDDAESDDSTSDDAGSDPADDTSSSESDAEGPDSDESDGSEASDDDSLFQERLDTFSDHLQDLGEGPARAVLSVADQLTDEDLTDTVVRRSRSAYDRMLVQCGQDPPTPLSLDEAPSIIADLESLPTLSGLKPQDVAVSKQGEDGLLVSLPVTMIPDDLRPDGSLSCLVDYHALVDAGMPPHLDLEALLQEYRRLGVEPDMNRTRSGIEWAALSLSPVTGCRHGCPFCYARDIAVRFYPQGFTPTFYPERLLGIRDATVPDRASDDWRYRNCFISSMGDLFGGWIPTFMIEAVLEEVRAQDALNFIFLTKYATRLGDFEYPDNAWVGTSVIEQKWVDPAEKAFEDVDAEVTWISAEPLLSDLDFDHLDRFDWIVYGGQTAASGEPARQPDWAWVRHLREQARAAGCTLFQKSNLTVHPRHSPTQQTSSKDLSPLWD